ncbi:MAG: reverse transcriptase domain-containing protein [Agriterribacter sp.]
MKRIGNLFEKIVSVDNLHLADKNARKGKGFQYGIKVHDRNREENINALHLSLVSKTYRTSEYTTFKVYEPKEREVYRLPYYPDRIVHHAIMNIMEPIFVSVFTADTYSCIKRRGIHAAANNLKSALKDFSGTTYCLKLDIKKFYPSVDHAVLKHLLRRKVKDSDLLWLLDEIIDSAMGLPIGNYLSQYFANFYLTYFDHWIKETKAVKYYFRYADDLVILHNDKQYLHSLLKDISRYLNEKLNLQVKSNYQVFPVESRSIDFVGYRFYHTHTLLRKSIKKNFARMLARRKNPASIASYWGWAKHADTKNLIKKLLDETVQRHGYQTRNKKPSRLQNQHQQNIKQGGDRSWL